MQSSPTHFHKTIVEQLRKLEPGSINASLSATANAVLPDDVSEKLNISNNKKLAMEIRDFIIAITLSPEVHRVVMIKLGAV